MKSLKQESTKERGKKFFMYLGITQMLFIFFIAASPVIWIWHSFDLAWKTGLTGLLGAIIIAIVYNTFKKLLNNAIDEQIDETPERITFQERLDQAMEKAKNKKS